MLIRLDTLIEWTRSYTVTANNASLINQDSEHRVFATVIREIEGDLWLSISAIRERIEKKCNVQ